MRNTKKYEDEILLKCLSQAEQIGKELHKHSIEQTKKITEMLGVEICTTEVDTKEIGMNFIFDVFYMCDVPIDGIRGADANTCH